MSQTIVLMNRPDEKQNGVADVNRVGIDDFATQQLIDKRQELMVS
jgi:hypothetical protein